MEQLWERIREGRKETNRKPSTRTGKENTGNRVGKNGESLKAKAEGKGESAEAAAEIEADGRRKEIADEAIQ